MFNSEALPPGIPSISDYKKLLKTDLFLEMESFSNVFLKTHAKTLKNYGRRWVTDPFHQWSRQWEYPFAYSYIQQHIVSNSKFILADDEIRILDAGSGCTFFPYYLSYKYPNCRLYCCDYDSSLTPTFSEINKDVQKIHGRARVEFNVCDLSNLGYKDDSFDMIYCVSVLEHTNNSDDIIKQFKRVLKPNGLLIVTFDISLDGKSPITASIAQDLLNMMNNTFNVTNPNFQEVSTGVQDPDILTTEFARNFNKKLLPWKLTWKSFFMQLRGLKLPRRFFFNVTIFCGVWRKSMESNSES